MKTNKNLLNMVRGAIFCALVFLLTMFLHIPTVGSNYIHLGDFMIYIAGCFMPWPYAVFASAVGAALADCASAVAMWAPFTLIIKALMVLCFTYKQKILCKRNIIGVIIAGIINVGGYAIAEFILTKQCLGVVSTLIQTLGNTVVFIIVGIIFDKINFKNKIGF